jgi:hypothetical protein
MSAEFAHLPANLSEIMLDGDGPFALPVCEADVDLRITDTFTTLVMRTILEGKEVHVGFDHAVLRRLRELVEAAIATIEAGKNGPVMTDAEPLLLAAPRPID